MSPGDRMTPMEYLPDIRRTAKVAGGLFAALQVATVAALLLVVIGL